MRHQDFSTQPTKNNLREWLGFFLPNLVYTGLGPKQSGLKPSSARQAVVLIYVDWMRSHMSKSFVNCQTHMNINCYCWIIYKCNLKCFKCVRVAYHACPHHASHWSAPDFEKALMGRPRSHASKIASSKQGRQSRKYPRLTAVCSGCNLQCKGRKATHTPSGYNTAIQTGQSVTIPQHPFG